MKKYLGFLLSIFLTTNVFAAQHDYVIDNQLFPAFRTDLNNGLNAIVTNNSGATAPASKFTYMFWADTTAGKQKFWDGTAWLTLWDLTTGAPEIQNDQVTEAMLKAVNAATDEQCLTFESAVGDFEWQICGTHPVDDATAIVKGSVDGTKQVRIEADGLTASTTRVITMPDANVDLSVVNQTSGNPHSVTKSEVSLGEVPNVKQNLTATVNPAVTDDSGSGYAVGSRWINTSTDKEFVCLDASVGAAVWIDTTAGAAGGIGNVVEDLTPQLGGGLDVNGNSIVSVTNGPIAITPNGTGKIILDGINWPTADGTANQILETDGAGNLSFITPTSGLQAKVGQFSRDSSLASGNQAVTGVGFQSSAVAFFCGENNTNDEVSWGFSDGTNEQVVSRSGETPDKYFTNRTNVVHALQSSGVEYVGDLNSMDSDGFTVAWTKTGATTGIIYCNYLALK